MAPTFEKHRCQLAIVGSALLHMQNEKKHK
jgi:hypothetical protein